MIDNATPSQGCTLTVAHKTRLRTRDFYYLGYDIGVHITGWCLFVTKECIQKIGELDESFEFWYSDNVYADQLIRSGIRHGLYCNVRVDHLTSVTLKTLPPREQRRYSFGAKNKYYILKNVV